MPLVHSPTDKARSKNIATEIRAGRSPSQAAAIAYRIQRTEQRARGQRVTPRHHSSSPRPGPARAKRKATAAQLAALAKGRAARAKKHGHKSAHKKHKATPAQLAALAKGRARLKKAHHRGVVRRKLTHARKGGYRSVMAKRSKKRSHSHALARRHHSPAVHGHHSRGLRRAAHHVASAASDQKHLVAALGAAAALGFAEAEGWSIPVIGGIGEAATLGLAAWGLDKFGVVKSKMLRHAATGLLAIAVHDFVKSKAGGAKTSGDEDIEGAYAADHEQ